jgi:putative ABC transport system permease protein
MGLFSKHELGEGLRIATAALKANRLRTILTTLGIFIGVIVVTVIISVIQGLNHFVSSQMSGLGTDTMYITNFPWFIKSYEDYLRLAKNKRITSDQYKELQKQVTLAAAVAPEIDTRKKVSFKNESLDNVRIRGTTDGFMITANALPESGRFFSTAEVDLRRNICVIGWEVSDKLFKDSNPIGKVVKVGSYSFGVVGVMGKRGNIFGDSQDDMVLIPYTVFEKIYGTRRSLVVQVKAVDPKWIENLNDELTGIMRRIRGLKANQENNFAINQQSQLMDIYNNLTRVLWIVLIGIGSISLLVGGIGIMNIMLVSVTERTREIGIRKAIGAKKRVILWQFLLESVFISGMGVTIGILVSLGIALLIRSISPIPVYISTYVLFLGLGFTLVIGLFFGIYPASKAARLDPIVALRYE